MKKQYSIKEYAAGIKDCDITILARAITLIESNLPKHIDKAQQLLKELIPFSGNSIRIGITGAPGAGKSTFIEALGTSLCNQGNKVAVLAVDPSSNRSKGSILGDKTRMEELSQCKNAFIRPSPSGGTLGGVAKKTKETILLCEAAGFNIILIETIGVGQSEITVRSMSDMFCLILLPGGGDELQGIKKGAVELSDLIVVNKADGDNALLAAQTRSQYEMAIHYVAPATEGWNTKVLTCSALKSVGITDVWDTVNEYIKNTKESGMFDLRRKEQLLQWVYNMVEEQLKTNFYNHPEVMKIQPQIEKDVLESVLTPTTAVNELLKRFFG